MEAFSAMMFADLPPVGDRVDFTSDLPLPQFPGYRAIWLQSGTSALALALLHARSQRPEIKSPEVLLPAYGCPDLVSAAIYAGVKPVLVDTGAEDPGYDLRALEASLTPNTIAAIAVNFLGIRERLEAIKAILPSGVALLEDNAQWHPEMSETTCLLGDYAITSFGRGKPASVLGGGLLLLHKKLPFKPQWLVDQIDWHERESAGSKLKYRSKLMLYNCLRRPHCYFWLNRNPLLTLGATRYKPLNAIEAMSPSQQSLVAANVNRHLSGSRWRETYYDEIFADTPALRPLSMLYPVRRGRLLRYPVLCNSEERRDELLAVLRSRGLGASALYHQELRAIPDVENRVAIHRRAVHAPRFAARLLTLPVHSGVTARHMQAIAAVCHDRQPGHSSAHETA